MTAQLYLAVLLLLMALGQALSFTRFKGALSTYGILAPYSVARAARLVITAEAAAGVGLLLPWDAAHWIGAVLGLVVAVGWTWAAAVALRAKREVPNCGCFGTYASQPLRKSVLAQDAVFVGLAGWVVATCPLP